MCSGIDLINSKKKKKEKKRDSVSNQLLLIPFLLIGPLCVLHSCCGSRIFL